MKYKVMLNGNEAIMNLTQVKQIIRGIRAKGYKVVKATVPYKCLSADSYEINFYVRGV